MAAAAAGLLGPPDAPPAGDSEIEVLHGERPDRVTFEDPRLSFFCADPATPPERLCDLLAAAWDLDPVTTLKLVFNLRGVRGTGKADRESFCTATLWLQKNHPKTLALNLSAFADFGCIEDLPELLNRLINGADARKVASITRLAGRSADAPASSAALPPLADVVPAVLPLAAEVVEPVDQAMQLVDPETVAIGVNQIAMASTVYNTDADYRFLFDRIAEFFADCLAADLNQHKSGNTCKIGLAAKWCPSVGTSFDQALLLCEAIARRLFPRDSKPEYGSLTEDQYTYDILGRFHGEVLVPLRAALELPYAPKPKVTLQSRINAGIVLPHELVPYLENGVKASTTMKEKAHQSWINLVDGLRANGLFTNCLAVCDVLGYNRGLHLMISVALGILISELSQPPWALWVHAFSEISSPHLLSPSYGSKIDFLRHRMKDMCTNKFDLKLVFDWILSLACGMKIKPQKMVKTIFVFTKNDFEEASLRLWEADYRTVRDDFHRAGYRDVVPQVVVWNLEGPRSAVLTSMKDGVMTISGFSNELMKLFLEKEGVVEPEDEMHAAIAGDEYNNLSVID